MRKKMDHRLRRNAPENPEIREVSPDEGEEVVRLGLEGQEESGEPEVARLRPDRANKAERRGVTEHVLLKDLAPAGGAATPEEFATEEGEDLEEQWEEEKKRRGTGPMGLLVLVGILVLAVWGVAMWGIPKGDARLDRKAEEMAEKLLQQELDMQEAEVLMGRIEDIVRSYLAAATIEEKLQQVRMKERVRPLMENYYRTHPLDPQVFERVIQFQPIGLGSYPFIVLTVRVESGATIGLLLEDGEDGTVLVDWESQVAYQPMSLAQYVEAKPEESMTFRVNVAYDQFYAYEFVDKERYVSLFLSERDEDGFLFGYVERGSAVHAKVVALLGPEPVEGRGRRLAAMLLKVGFLPESRAMRSVLVEKVVAPGWAFVHDPDEEDD